VPRRIRSPKRADARRNRERILVAADELFARDGLSVPLDDIARQAGVGPGTVHRHFPTKESLFAAVAADRLDQVIAEAHVLRYSRSPGDALRRLISLMLEEGSRSAPLKGALEGSDFDIRAAAPDAAAELRDAAATILVRAQDVGAVRPDIDVDELMALVAGSFAALRHAGADGARASRLTAVLFEGLRLD
jgi:AcrR family transcriptional regulator